jgi:hypothetical protein
MIENGYEGPGRRRFPRIAMDFDVRMIDVDLRRADDSPPDAPCYETRFVSTIAVGRNISEGGFAFESQTQPDVGSILGLELALPEQNNEEASPSDPSPSGGKRGFRALGQVVWGAGRENKYTVGVQFIGLDRGRSAALRSLVAHHNMVHNSCRFARAGSQDPASRLEGDFSVFA